MLNNRNKNNNKRSIGIVLRAFDLGGAEKQSLILAKLIKPYFNVYFFLQKEEPCLEQHLKYAKEADLEVIFLKGGIINRMFQLLQYKKNLKIELFMSYLTIDNVLCMLSSVWSSAKFVGGIRSSFLPKNKLFANKLAQNYFLDKVVYNNYYGLDVLAAEGFDPNKASVIHNCIEGVLPQLNRNVKEKIQILSVGRFNELKDYETAIKSFSFLMHQLKVEQDVEYVIIGDGELEMELRALIIQSQLPNIILVNNPGDLDSYYRSADIYFLSSKIEGLPNTIMEAMSYSLPVVSTLVGDVKYLVQDGVNGLLAPIADYEALARHLKTLIDNHELRSQMGAEGNKFLSENFSTDRFLKKNLELINELI